MTAPERLFLNASGRVVPAGAKVPKTLLCAAGAEVPAAYEQAVLDYLAEPTESPPEARGDALENLQQRVPEDLPKRAGRGRKRKTE